MEKWIILPTQLFYEISNLEGKHVYLVEEPFYFTRYNFHKMKLAYHRASMKRYYDYLSSKKIKVEYVEYKNVNKFYKSITFQINMYDPIDTPLIKELVHKIPKLKFYQSKNYLITPNEIEQIKDKIKKGARYYHDIFYKLQRKKLDILMKDGQPIGNKWSFDDENRLSFPSKINTISLPKVSDTMYYDEAISYIEKNFSDNYGEYEMRYPLDEKSSIKWLNNFLKEKLKFFGPYQDAVNNISQPFGYHSVISPMMNIGILPDTLVLKLSYDYYLKNKNKIPLQSFEGFIRQVIGWRNYVYAIYVIEGEKLRKSNFFKHKNRINDKWWQGKTNITPVDTIIKKIVKYSYAHHIERLMYLGNWLLLCKVLPDDVYKIFMEWTIDAYDWVMVPNVYGMSQHASTIMMTRPYFSSSNYLFRMSNFKKNKLDNWHVIWDAVYYSFINDHKAYLEKNYATARQVKHWNNKTKKEKEELLEIAKNYLKKLFNKK